VPGAIASLQLTPQGVVHSFYPLKGNEAAMGHNVLKGQRQAVNTRIDYSQLHFVGSGG
jgi:sensor domain CHASE-containing protein